MPRFSIVIPVYNVAPYLSECLDSVLMQTFIDWEAICVDDGSTDGSGAILDEYALKDRRLCVIHQANAGVSAARNVALEVVNGEWILFVDPDDSIHPRILQEIANVVTEDKNIDILRFKFFKYADGEDVKWGSISPKVEIEDSSRIVRSRQFMAGLCSHAYSRKVSHGIRFRPYVHGEDMLYCGTCLSRSEKVAFIDFAAYAYRQRNGSAIHRSWTLRTLVDEVAYRVEWLEIMQRKNKNVEKGLIRTHELFSLEAAPYLSCELSKEDQYAFESKWRELMRQMLKMTWFNPVSKAIIGINIFIPHRGIFLLTTVYFCKTRRVLSNVKAACIRFAKGDILTKSKNRNI